MMNTHTHICLYTHTFLGDRPTFAPVIVSPFLTFAHAFCGVACTTVAVWTDRGVVCGVTDGH